jgi:predicted MFS family arabinose efflux permease
VLPWVSCSTIRRATWTTRAAVDVLIAIAGASGGALSGMVVDASSYATLSLAGGFLAVLLLPAVTWYRAGRPRPA